MQIEIEIQNASGTLSTPGPITTATSVTVTRRLDRAGSVKWSAPASDQRVLEFVQSKRRAIIRVDSLNGQPITEIARMVIETIGDDYSASAYNRSISGVDSIGELKFINTRRGRKFAAARVDSVFSTLLGLVPGWSYTGEAENLISARFDGASVLKAINALVEQQGIHFRQSATNQNVLELGAFGESNGLTILAGQPTLHAYDPCLLYAESLHVEEESSDIVNWIEPIGAGRGDAAITLERSTRTSPYPIVTETGPDGRTIYAVQDQGSIDKYGLVELTGEFKGITLVGTTLADQIAGANALYDMTVAHLLRYKDPYFSYGMTVRGNTRNLKPGDKIAIHGSFPIVDDMGYVAGERYLDTEVWIMEVAETISTSGRSTSLTIASVDRVAASGAEIVVGRLEQIRLNNVSVESYPAPMAGFVYKSEIDPTHDFTIPIDITNRVQNLLFCTLRFTTGPFVSTASAAASGGGSAVTSAGGGASTETSTLLGLSSGFAIPIGPDHRHDIAAHGHDVNLPSHTHSVTIPSHTHALDYELATDSQTPDEVSIEINGVDRTDELGGPWAVGGGGVDVTLEIGDILNLESDIQQRHTITFSCADGQGLVEVTVSPHVRYQTVEVYD